MRLLLLKEGCGGHRVEPGTGVSGLGNPTESERVWRVLSLGLRMVHGPIFVENPDGSITEASSV